MIAIVRLSLTQGEVASEEHLYKIVSDIYPSGVVEAQSNSIFGQEEQSSPVNKASVYVCAPDIGSLARFFLTDSRDFEVVIETVHGGNLLRSSERVVRVVQRRLKCLDMKANVEVALEASCDARTYISGRPNNLNTSLQQGLKDNLVALVIAIILISIAKVWLTQYLEEAIAGSISLLLFTFWQAYKIRYEVLANPFGWKVGE